MAALLYGLQRTGSNYTEQLINKNFPNIKFYNDYYSRCLPTHKHFRLYDKKWIAPQAKFYNNYYYKNFNEFKEHVNQLTKKQIELFVVTIKNPYSWYISYKKHAKKNRYVFYKNYVNSQYIIDYNLYYKKWYDFSIESPKEVIFVKYENLIHDLESALNAINNIIGIKENNSEFINPAKVPMSHRFSKRRERYYKQDQYLTKISPKEKFVINQLLDSDLMERLGYDMAI